MTAAAETTVANVAVELRTITFEHDAETSAVVCVVMNASEREIFVWKGYDGKRNQLLGDTGSIPMVLDPVREFEPTRVEIAPGKSETLYVLPLDDIFFRDGKDERTEWSWKWLGSPPCAAPPVSPL